jgi:hypothetical protein
VVLTPLHAILPLLFCSKVDLLAFKVGASPHLASRAAMAMTQCLSEAAGGEGHTYLPWQRLEREAGRLLRDVALQHAAPWEHAQALHLVAQLMHNSRALVAEPEGQALQEGAAAAAAGEGTDEAAVSGSGLGPLAPAAEAAAASSRQHPSFDGIQELRAYLDRKLGGGWAGQLPLKSLDCPALGCPVGLCTSISQ